MGDIESIRQSIDRKLDRWEARASALEGHLGATREDAAARVEQKKAKLRDTLDHFEAQIATANDLGQEQQTSLRKQVDNLKLQLALGKMDARDNLDEQSEKIRQAWTEFSSAVDRDLADLGEDMQTVEKKLVADADELEAEMDGMRLQFAQDRDEVRRKLAEGKTELGAKIDAFKATIAKKRGSVQEKADEFEHELTQQSKAIWEDLVK